MHQVQRVEADENWNLFCPNEAPGLSDKHSDEFKVDQGQFNLDVVCV